MDFPSDQQHITPLSFVCLSQSRFSTFLPLSLETSNFISLSFRHRSCFIKSSPSFVGYLVIVNKHTAEEAYSLKTCLWRFFYIVYSSGPLTSILNDTLFYWIAYSHFIVYKTDFMLIKPCKKYLWQVNTLQQTPQKPMHRVYVPMYSKCNNLYTIQQLDLRCLK